MEEYLIQRIVKAKNNKILIHKVLYLSFREHMSCRNWGISLERLFTYLSVVIQHTIMHARTFVSVSNALLTVPVLVMWTGARRLNVNRVRAVGIRVATCSLARNISPYPAISTVVYKRSNSRIQQKEKNNKKEREINRWIFLRWPKSKI